MRRVEGEKNLFIPSSVLKELKKEFWVWVSKHFKSVDLESTSVLLQKKRKIIADVLKNKKSKSRDFGGTYLVSSGKNSLKKGSISARSIYNFRANTDEVVLPFFCTENELEKLEKLIENAYKSGIRRFRITSLFQLSFLQKYEDVKLILSFPFPVTNSFVARALNDYPVVRIQAWIELEKTEIEALVKKSHIEVEIYRYGRPAILATRSELQTAGMISDARKKSFICLTIY